MLKIEEPILVHLAKVNAYSYSYHTTKKHIYRNDVATTTTTTFYMQKGFIYLGGKHITQTERAVSRRIHRCRIM